MQWTLDVEIGKKSSHKNPQWLFSVFSEDYSLLRQMIVQTVQDDRRERHFNTERQLMKCNWMHY